MLSRKEVDPSMLCFKTPDSEHIEPDLTTFMIVELKHGDRIDCCAAPLSNNDDFIYYSIHP